MVVSGCATHSIRPQISNSSFQEENLPIRTLRVVMVMDAKGNEDRGRRIIQSTSNLIKPQVGIELEVVRTIKVEGGFVGLGRNQSMTKLYKTVRGEGLRRGTDFDLAVGISSYSFVNVIAKVLPIPAWIGVIDDNLCKCFYVTKSASPRINAHEIMHAFIFIGVHRGGLMSAIQIDILPGIPIIGGGRYLLEKDREEVLIHKWRDMSKPIHEENPIDVIDDTGTVQ